jgi:hypothetical protein
MPIFRLYSSYSHSYLLIAMTDTNPPQERAATNPDQDRRRQLLASLERSVSRDAEIRDATHALLYRFASLEPERPGETEREARERGFQNDWRLDEVRSAMLAALQNG